MEEGHHGEAFHSLNITAVLDADPRPVFVLDLDPDYATSNGTAAISPIFCNSALSSHERLLDAVLGDHPTNGTLEEHEKSQEALLEPVVDVDLRPTTTTTTATTHSDFKAWATGVTTHDDSKDVFPQSLSYQGLMWTGSTVHKRWRLISGNSLWRLPEHAVDLASGAPLEVATGGQHAGSGSRNAMTQKSPSAKTRDHEDGDNRSVAAVADVSVESLHEDEDRLSPIFYPRQSASSSSIKTRNSRSSKNISMNLETLPERATIDWTVPNPEGQLSQHLQYVRGVDWGATSLGTMETWSSEFRQIANLVMTNPHPAALFWGSKLTVIYNEAYAAEVAGNKHPTLMGTDFADFFAEIWDYCGPLFEECGRSGISVRKDNDFLSIYRHGMLEETYYSWTYVPMYSNVTRELLGFYNGPFQTTSMVLNARRMQTINAIGEHTGAAKTVKQFWKLVLESLEQNPRDVPFAIVYSVGEDDDGEFSSAASETSISMKSCHLEGSLGVPEGHTAAPPQLDLRRSREGFVPSFREAMRTREPTLLRVRDGTLPEALLEGIKWRGFGEPCKEAVIFPVRPTTADNVLAFLVLGVNPRRPYDDEYKAFSIMFNRQIATSLASTILFEEETRRMRDAFEAAHLEKGMFRFFLHSPVTCSALLLTLPTTQKSSLSKLIYRQADSDA